MLCAALLTACAADSPTDRTFRLGVTTTIEDSGLLTNLQAGFAQSHPQIRMSVLSGGTGEVLRLARNRDVDVTLTHEPIAESTFVAEGHGRERRDVMYNYFVIAGPAADPAGIRGVTDAPAALQRVAQTEAPFVSRGDDSGTHRKELFLWKEAGSSVPAEKPAWYIEAGVGMGEALRVASARAAYLLTDQPTYLNLRSSLQLEILSEGDPRLLNRYAVIRVTDATHAEAADSFALWLTGPRGKEVIANFGRAQHGRPLFEPPK